MILSCQNLSIDTLRKNNLDLKEHFVLGVLWSYENKNNTMFMSLDKLADYMNISARSLDNTIKSLKYKGFIYCEKNEKHLSTLGLFYCKSVFNYKPYKPKKKPIKTPDWYDKYKQDIQVKPIIENKKANDNIQELANELFNNWRAFLYI